MALRIRKSITLGAASPVEARDARGAPPCALANGSEGLEDLEEVYEPDPGSREVARLLGRDPSPDVSSG